jgi:hypothetical protein
VETSGFFFDFDSRADRNSARAHRAADGHGARNGDFFRALSAFSGFFIFI